MKVLQILPSPIRGGAEEYALTLGKGIAGHGYEVHAAFPHAEGTVTLVQDYQNAGITYHPLEIRPGKRGLKPILTHCYLTLRLLSRLRPTVVQVSLPFPDQGTGSLLASAMLGIPVVCVFQLVNEDVRIDAWHRKFYAWLRTRRQAWIAISKNNRDLVAELFDMSANKISVIYNGPCRRVSAPEVLFVQQVQELREEIGAIPADKIILTVGRLHPQKGYQFIVRIIPEILKRHPEALFVWVGEGEQRQALEAELREYKIQDRVRILGYRNDVPNLMRVADLFLFPTLYEGGSSIALVEAMESGLPIVASDASGIPEVVDNRVHGILFQKGSMESMREALEWALSHGKEMERFATAARYRVKDFSIEKMVSHTLELLIQQVDRR